MTVTCRSALCLGAALVFTMSDPCRIWAFLPSQATEVREIKEEKGFSAVNADDVEFSFYCAELFERIAKKYGFVYTNNLTDICGGGII